MRTWAGNFARRLGRLFACLTLASTTLAMMVPAPGRADGAELEARVKAEFIERFTHFIDWPPTAFAGPDAPFVLCVVGRTPVANYLDALAHTRTIKDRRVQLRRPAPSGDLSACHLVFIAPDERPRLKQILDAVDGRPIVTVADSEGFGRAGVLINLVLDSEGRVRFEISPAGARRSALTLNAQLLRLSRLVSDDGGP